MESDVRKGRVLLHGNYGTGRSSHLGDGINHVSYFGRLGTRRCPSAKNLGEARKTGRSTVRAFKGSKIEGSKTEEGEFSRMACCPVSGVVDQIWKIEHLRNFLADPKKGLLSFPPLPLPLDAQVQVTGIIPGKAQASTDTLGPQTQDATYIDLRESQHL